MTRPILIALADFSLACAASFAIGLVVGVAFFRSLPI
jgi:hypothetical protein